MGRGEWVQLYVVEKWKTSRQKVGFTKLEVRSGEGAAVAGGQFGIVRDPLWGRGGVVGFPGVAGRRRPGYGPGPRLGSGEGGWASPTILQFESL